MLVIAQGWGQKWAAAQLVESLVEFLGNKIELGVGGIAKAQDSKVEAGERSKGETLSEDEAPEALHVIGRIALPGGGADKDDQRFVDKVGHWVDVQGGHLAAEAPAAGLPAETFSKILGCARLAAKKDQEAALRHYLEGESAGVQRRRARMHSGSSVLRPCRQSRSEAAAAAMDASLVVPEWKKALLERKRAKRVAEAVRFTSGEGAPRRCLATASLSRLLELYSASPVVRTIHAERIIIIETCPGEAAHRRVVSGAAELRAEEVVVYEPEPGPVRRLRRQFDPVRMRPAGAPVGRKPASDGLVRLPVGQRTAFRMRGEERSAGREEAAGAVRMRGRNRLGEASLRMPGSHLFAFRNPYMQMLAANSFLVKPRGRWARDPKQRVADSKEVEQAAAGEGALPGAATPGEFTWPDATLPKESAWPDATLPKESAWPNATLPKESAWPDATLPKESAWPDATLPKESAWPDASNTKEGAWRDAPPSRESTWPHATKESGPAASERCAPMAGEGSPRLAPSLPCGSQAGHQPVEARSLPLRGSSTTIPPELLSSQSWRCASRPSLDADRVPVTRIDGDLAPLGVLSPRLEGCDISEDGPVGASGLEPFLLGGGSGFERAGRYPQAEEIEVIGGYLSLDRSCMSKGGARRRKKLKISFDEARLQTMFEYPSESSLVVAEEDSEVDEGQVTPPRQPNSGSHSAGFKEEAPGAKNLIMLTPASAGTLSDFSSEPALYF